MAAIQSVKVLGGGNSPGHVGVVEMAMGVDEAGQQDDFAEVEDFFAQVRAQIFPRRDGPDFIPDNKNRAVLDGRRGDGEERFWPAGSFFAASCRVRLERAATLCLVALCLLWRLRICCSIFLVTASIAA